MSDYVYQEYPKWVNGVDHLGNVVPMIVRDESEEAEQVERVKALEAAKEKASKSRKGGKADDAGTENEGAEA